jgi:hypothetical protein
MQSAVGAPAGPALRHVGDRLVAEKMATAGSLARRPFAAVEGEIFQEGERALGSVSVWNLFFIWANKHYFQYLMVECHDF